MSRGCRIEISGKLPAAFGVARGELKAAARHFAECSSRRCGVPFRSVAVVLQDDAASDEVHRAVMGVAGATDVITQRYEAMPPEPEGVYGELYVNTNRALVAFRKGKGWSAAKELLLYVAHGMDHLSGADDAADADYAAMRRRELRWIANLLARA